MADCNTEFSGIVSHQQLCPIHLEAWYCRPPGEKSANSTYRPITLTCCIAKLSERLILNRVRPTIDPRLDECQAGFRYGSDVQVYALLETLRLRQDVATYCAFLDIRKAFDVAWRDGAMLRLHRAGVPHDLWHS